MPPKPRRPPLRAVLRRALPPLAVACAVMVVLLAAAALSELRASRQLLRDSLAEVVFTQTEVLERDLEALRRSVTYLSEQPLLGVALDDDGARAALEAAWVTYCRHEPLCEHVRLLDAAGTERVRVNRTPSGPRPVPRADLQPKGDRAYARAVRALAPGEIYVSRIDLNVENHRIEEPWRPVIRLATPLLSPAGTRGALVINVRADDLLQAVEDAQRRSAVQTLLIDGDGYVLHGGPGPDWGFMFDRPPAAPRWVPEAWAAREGRPEGTLEAGWTLYAWHTVVPGPGSLPVVVLGTVPASTVRGRVGRTARLAAWVAAVSLVGVVPLCLALGLASARRDDQQAELRASEARLRRLSAALIDTREREQERIARDLHDTLGQELTLLNLTLQQARAASDPAERDAALRDCTEALGRTMQSAHELAGAIRPTVLDDVGLEHAARTLAADWERRTSLPIRLEVDLAGPVAPAVAEPVFRILQEALRNAHTHARCTRVDVRLAASEEELELRVRDDGVGFDEATVDPDRLGLLGMRERAELVGGTLEVTSEAGRGTMLRVCIPSPLREAP